MGTLLAASEELVLRLPLPLAQLHRRALNSKTALERHQAAYYLWEASLKLLASSALVEYAGLGDHDPELRERLKNLARPSLGHWWEITRRLLPILADAEGSGEAARRARDLVLGRQRDDLPRSAGLDSLLREVLESSAGSRSTVRLSELFDRLVRYRNRELGHGAAGQRPQDFYERMGRSLLHATEEVLALLDVCLGSSLIFVSDVRRQASGTWLVERYELRGESPRRIESLEVPDSQKDSLPHPARVHLQSSQGLRSLHPLVLHELESGEFFFLNARRQRSRAEYLSYSTGRVVDRGDLEADRRELLGQLLGARVAEEEARAWAERSEKDEPEAAAPPAAPARRSIGEFEVLSRIGRGGMGVVYRAWQPSLSRQVALKCLLGSGDPRTETRFAREIRALGRVDHPNLVKVYSSGSEGDQWFYAMELIEGADVASVLEHLASTSSGEVGESEWERALSTACVEAKRKEESVGSSDPSKLAPREEPLPPPRPTRPTARGHIEQVISIARQASEAAHALHEAGVVHRDIKPGNIMLTQDGAHAVLMDLGVAQLADEAEGRLTRTRQFVGTLRYASPEQVLAAGSLDRRSDVYSLGATLFELLTLRPLFGATDETPPPDLMLRIQSADPGKPSRLNPKVPRDLDAIVLKCLEKDRARRYGTARELAEDLARFERGEAVEAQPPTLGYLLAKSIRRHRKRYALVAALLLAAIVGVALAFWRIERAWLAAETALFDSYTDTGIKAGMEGSSGTALLWFSRASEVARGDEYRQRMNRIRQKTFAKDIPRTLRALPHPGESIASLAFHPASAHLLVGSEAGKATIWDLVKEEKLALPGGERKVSSSAWRPGGETLLLATPEGDVGLFAWPSGKRLTGPPVSGALRTFAWTRDGRRLALSTDRLRIWDMAKESLLERDFEHPAPVVQVRFDETGERLLTAAEDKKARLFAVEGSAKAEPMFPPVPHFVDWISPAFLDRGRAIVTVSSWAEVTRWHAGTGRMVQSIPHVGWVQGIATTEDGGLFLVRGYLRVEIRDGRSGRRFGIPLEFRENLRSAIFSPDGSTFLTAGQDRTLSLWEVSDDHIPMNPVEGTDRITRRSGAVHTVGLRRVAWSSDGRFVAVAEEGGLVRVEAWTANEQELSVREGFQATGLTLSADSRLLLTIGQRLSTFGTRCESRVFEAGTGRPLGPFLRVEGILTGGALSLDGNLAVTLNCLTRTFTDRQLANYRPWDKAGRIRFWDWKKGKEVLPPIETAAEPLDIASAPDGGLFAVALASGRILLIDPATGAQAGALDHGERAQTIMISHQGMLAFSPGGESLATWNLGKSLRVWDTRTRGPRIPPIIQQAPVFAAAFSGDNRKILAAAGRTLTVWDPSSGGRMAPPILHPGPILHSVFHPDGERILTASSDGRIRLWDWKSGRLDAPELPHSAPGASTAHFLLDPDLVLTSGAGMTPHVWEVGTGKLLAPPRPANAPWVSQTFFIDGGKRAVVAGESLALYPLEDFVDPPRSAGSEASLLARVHSGEKPGAGGLATPLTQEEWLEDWRTLRRNHPEECAFDPSMERTIEWHRLMADRLEKSVLWDSARWHVERLRGLGERADQGQLLRFERFVRAWHFAEKRRSWDRFGDFSELGAEDIREIEESALREPLHHSRFPYASFFERYSDMFSDTTGYALRTIRSPAARRLKLLVGSDDGVRIWLDGAIVHQHLVGREAVADQDEAWMDLPAGEHRLLVEVTQHFGDWRLYLRFEDEAGRELRLTDEGDLEPIPGG